MAKKAGITRLLELTGEKKKLLIAASVLSSISAILMLVPYISVYFILKELLEHAADPSLADGAIMIRWGGVALGGLLLSLMMMYGGGLFSHIAAFRILYQLRVRLSNHISTLPLGWIKSKSIGTIKKTLDQNVEKVETFVAHQLPDLIHVIVTTIVMVVVMFYMNVWLALACLVPIIIAFIVQIALMSGEKSKEGVKLYYDALDRMSGSAVQYVRGIPAIKVFGQTVHSFRRFYKDMIHYRDFCIQYTDQYQTGYLIFKVMLGSLVVFILPVGVYILSGDAKNVAFASVLLFFLIMAPGISTPMFKMMSLFSTLRDINEGVRRMDEIFDEKSITEPSHSRIPSTYEVSFEAVSFAYASIEPEANSTVNEQESTSQVTHAKALSNLSFTAQQGQMTALVGPSGAGKSTVASLIPRFWDVNEGNICIGGIDIRDMQSRDLMNTVAFVFQETFLFYDTVYNNIAIGCENATHEEVMAAAKAAQCHEFITRLDQGYETLIGEGGVHLSGGEEQRVAVARAILKNAPILVLDEATAFADPENEYEMQQALSQLTKGKTVIMIAHRLSTIKDADQIIVLNDGKLVERGKHHELVAANGLYNGMWRAYTDAEHWQIRDEGE